MPTRYEIFNHSSKKLTFPWGTGCVSIPPHKSIQTNDSELADEARKRYFVEVIESNPRADEFFKLRKLAVEQGIYAFGDKLADLKIKLKEVL